MLTSKASLRMMPKCWAMMKQNLAQSVKKNKKNYITVGDPNMLFSLG